MERKVKLLFWFFWSITFLLSSLESATYLGFVIRHFRFDLFILLKLTVALTAVTVLINFLSGNKKFTDKDKIYISLSFLTIITHSILKVVNRLTYPNFVFSHFHIQPNNMQMTAFLSLMPTLAFTFPKVNLKKVFRVNFIFLSFLLIVIILNFYKIYKDENWALQFIIKNPRATYADKMRRAVGPVFYNYTQFIVKNTPENSLLLIPPQAFPWPQSGNGAFMRYFVYPRNLGNGGERKLDREKLSIKDFDYALLDWGETESVEPPFTHGWPKFDIPAEKIIFMSEDGNFASEIKGDYKYKEYENKRVWGLIKIKK